MIIATLGEKGGGGKSTIATQFLSAYFLKKYHEMGDDCAKREPLSIFEFDAHNASEEDLSSEILIRIVHVENNLEQMSEILSLIDYDSMDKDIIIDVGGSDNTDRFISLIKDESLASEIVFVLPEVNKRPRSVENTVKKLRDAISSPRIIIALNRYSENAPLKEEFKFFFGDLSMSISPSPLSVDKELCIASIPSCDVSLGLSVMGKSILWSLADPYRNFGHLNRDEKMVVWGTKKDGKVIDCDKETYIRKTAEVRQSREAADTIKSAASLFNCLDKQFERKA